MHCFVALRLRLMPCEYWSLSQGWWCRDADAGVLAGPWEVWQLPAAYYWAQARPLESQAWWEWRGQSCYSVLYAWLVIQPQLDLSWWWGAHLLRGWLPMVEGLIAGLSWAGFPSTGLASTSFVHEEQGSPVCWRTEFFMDLRDSRQISSLGWTICRLNYFSLFFSSGVNSIRTFFESLAGPG